MRRRGHRSKKKCDLLHAQRRASERLGYSMSAGTVKRLGQFVREKCNKRRYEDVFQYISKISGTRFLCRVFFDEMWINVIYSSSTNGVVTILPEDIRELEEVEEELLNVG